MNILFEQLRRYVPELPDDPERVAHALTMAGAAVDRISEVRGKALLELDITTNRPDLLSSIGVAREAAALGGHALELPPVELTEDISEAADEAASVSIDVPELCPRYSARVVRGVRMGPSPDWLREVLEASDVRPISNVVDITNFVLLEMGQPLHAFDLDKLEGRQIVVRCPRPGERLTTLEGRERVLDPDDLVIADATRCVALAGVMGGSDTEVGPASVDVLIESANFEPTVVRRTARRHGLRTEASVRFERGLDPGATIPAATRAAVLMAELAGGRVLEGSLDAYPSPAPPVRIRLRLARLASVLGLEVDETTVRRLLDALGLETEASANGALEASVPGFRPDLEREIDLIEEVGRLVGYDRVPSVLPPLPPAAAPPSARQRNQARLRESARAAGLTETFNVSLTEGARNELFRSEGSQTVATLNPISDRLAELAVSLLPGLLEATRLNLSRDLPGVALYELAACFRLEPGSERPEEPTLFACVLAGRPPGHWSSEPRDHDIWDVKGTVELLLQGLGVEEVGFEPTSAPGFQDGQTARVVADGVSLGHLGRLDPAALGPFDIELAVHGAELDLSDLLERESPPVKATSPSRYPAASRDVSMLVQGARYTELEALVQGLNEPSIESVQLIDRYEGRGLPEGATSLTLRVTFRHPDRTLEPEELAELHKRLFDTLGADPRITLRI